MDLVRHPHAIGLYFAVGHSPLCPPVSRAICCWTVRVRHRWHVDAITIVALRRVRCPFKQPRFEWGNVPRVRGRNLCEKTVSTNMALIHLAQGMMLVTSAARGVG